MDASGTIATFTPRAAPALNSATTASPCLPPSPDIEGVRFGDQQNHSVVEYFQNQ
jgi:hypothetical protein